MPTKTEVEIRKVFEASATEIDVSLLNFNCNPAVGSEASNTPTCLEYVRLAREVYPTVADAFTHRMKKQRKAKRLEIADSVMSPVWISPSSTIKLTNPKPFTGDSRTETVYKSIGAYETQQALARYNNGTLCAALCSKLKYDSKNTEQIEQLVDPNVPSSHDVKYVTERGLVNCIDERTTDFVRYIVKYQKANGKTGYTIISGDFTFIGGAVNITRHIHTHIKELRSEVKNDKYKGIKVSSEPVGSLSESDFNQSSVALCRALAGASLVAGHLTLLKNLYGVQDVYEIDLSRDKGDGKVTDLVPIQDVIDDYMKIERYAVMAEALNAIKD